jgi:hypothetical protein
MLSGRVLSVFRWRANPLEMVLSPSRRPHRYRPLLRGAAVPICRLRNPLSAIDGKAPSAPIVARRLSYRLAPLFKYHPLNPNQPELPQEADPLGYYTVS